eukprot:2705064-Pyramimonas_sp.AAC.1
MVANGRQWSPMVANGCQWSPMVADGRQWSPMVANGCRWLPMVKVWDIRTFKPVHQYFTATPATSMALSQKGLLAVGYGPHVQ